MKYPNDPSIIAEEMNKSEEPKPEKSKPVNVNIWAGKEKPTFSSEEAKKIGDEIGVDWDKIDQEEFRMGLEVEMEHGKVDPETNVTDDDPAKTGKIALIHLKELSDYYTRLSKMEKEGEKAAGG